MRPKFDLMSAIFFVAVLATPAYAGSQKYPAIRPPEAVFHNAPAPAFHPPIAAAPRVAYQQPPVRNFQPPVQVFRPPHQSIHRVPAPPGPRFTANQPMPKLPPLHLPGKPVNRVVTPSGPFRRPPLSAPPSGARGFVPPTDQWGYPEPRSRVTCDGDGDNCHQLPYGYQGYGYAQPYYPPAPPVVCDGDGDDCRQVPYSYPQYGYQPPYYNYQQSYAPYYSHPEPDGDDFNAYYLPYQAPPTVCDEDGDDCGPAPYFNESYRAWAPLEPIPVALGMNPAYYGDPNLYRLRNRLIAMDQAARARYATAVQRQQMRQARHLFHETRSLDGQLARLDSQARRGAGMHPSYSSASIR